MRRHMTKRHLLALPLLALLLVPAAAHAQARRSSSAGDGALHLGLLLGPEFATGDTGIALRGDVEMGISHLAPNVRLDGVFSLGYTRFSFGERYGDYSVNLVRLVPAARFVFPVAPAVNLYADAGLGLYLGSASAGVAPLRRDSESLFGLNMRFAGGVMFDVSPTIRLAGELGVNPYFGDVDDTTTTLMMGLQFRL